MGKWFYETGETGENWEDQFVSETMALPPRVHKNLFLPRASQPEANLKGIVPYEGKPECDRAADRVQERRP